MDRVFVARLPRPLPRAIRIPPLARRGRLPIVALAVAGALLAGGWLWLRHSSLVAVEQVRVSGVSGPEAGAIETALVEAAHRMSTLDASAGALRAAVAPFRVVSDVRVAASFPHTLRIEVVEQPPVAALTLGSAKTAVAADGVVLGPALLQATLPTLATSYLPPAGHLLSSPALRAGAALLGAAPGALRAHVASVENGARGVTITMRNGLLVYFGDATLAHAKWLALARVLADPSSAGAGYVDVRLPSRPAAGFAAGAGPATSTGTGAGTGSSSSEGGASGHPESAVSSLANGLAPPGASTTPANEEPSSKEPAATPSGEEPATAEGG